MNDADRKKNGSGKKKKVRALMTEMGTNYTTALRAYDAAIADRYAEEDAASVAGHPSAANQNLPQARESAARAPADSTLNLQFSVSPDTAVTADTSN